MKRIVSRVPLVIASAAIIVVGGWFAPSAPRSQAITLVDTGEQYMWTNPWSVPNDQSTFVKTQGRCGNGHSGHVTFRDENGNVLAGAITVPAEWKFSQGYGLTVPAGLPAGNNYYFDVDCGDQYGVQSGLVVTNGGVAQLLDFVDRVVNPTPVTAAPAGNTDPVIADPGDAPVHVTEGASTPSGRSGVSRSTRSSGASAPVAEAPVVTPDTTPTTVAEAPAVQELPTDVKKDEPKKIALKVAHDSSGYPPALPYGISGALIVSGVGLLLKARRAGAHYLPNDAG